MVMFQATFVENLFIYIQLEAGQVLFVNGCKACKLAEDKWQKFTI